MAGFEKSVQRELVVCIESKNRNHSGNSVKNQVYDDN